MIQMAGDNIVLNLAITLTSSPFNVTRNLLIIFLIIYVLSSPSKYHITRAEYYPSIIIYFLIQVTMYFVFKISSALAIISCLLWIRIFSWIFLKLHERGKSHEVRSCVSRTSQLSPCSPKACHFSSYYFISTFKFKLLLFAVNYYYDKFVCHTVDFDSQLNRKTYRFRKVFI